MNVPHVLVIDDDASVLDAMRTTLAVRSPPPALASLVRDVLDRPTPSRPSVDFAVETFVSGAAAARWLAEAGRFRPHVAFVDMRMPGDWDGLQTIEALWNLDPRLQIVICSAYSDHRWEDLLARFGENDRLLVLRKPFDPIEVRQMALAGSVRYRLEADRDRLEAALRAAARTEALARLSGGIVHDFNNLLTIIVGALAELRDDDDSEVLHYASQAAQQAVDLTRQLLVFSRDDSRGPGAEATVDANRLVQDCARMFSRIVPAGIAIDALRCDVDAVASVSRAELGRMLMNLVVNAADAMPHGGRITIQCSIEPAASWNLVGTDVVAISVTDTGTGMAPEVVERIFDPYFTTKGAEKGTGLGLAVVRSSIEAAKGAVRVASELGRGTTISLAIPRQPTEPLATELPRQSPPRGSERVLVIDDDPLVLRMTSLIFERHGYAVDGLTVPQAALELDDAALARIDLVVTDVNMPGMSGPELLRRLWIRRADLPAILVTGAAGLPAGVDLPERATWLRKPWSHHVMLGAMRRVLDRMSEESS